MNKKRLLKLAKHLESGKLGHKKFNFSKVNCLRDGTPSRDRCGYEGCAIGEVPICFPKAGFSWEDVIDAFDLDDSSKFIKFFGITEEEFDFLFVPMDEVNDLSDFATKNQVAKHIHKFVENGGIYDA